MKLKFLDILMEQDEKSEKIDTFRALRMYARGKISAYELQGFIPELKRIEKSSSNIRGEDKLILEFDGSEDNFFDMFNLSDDDEWLAKAVESGYYEHQDSSSEHSNWEDGYTQLDGLDKENLEKLDIISKKLVGKPFKNLERGEKSMREFLEKMETMFQRQYNNIVDYFNFESNNQVRDALSEVINRDINSIVGKYGFSLVSGYEIFKTTVVNLINLYANSRKQRHDLKSLLKDITQLDDHGMGSWGDDTYYYADDSKMDWESINRNVGWELDKILDKLEEEGGLNEFVGFYDRVTSKFSPERWYRVPKNPALTFKIEDFDSEKMKVNVMIFNDLSNRKIRYSFTEEGLTNFLVQHELFPILKNENFYRSL
jgi:hypothetical protein